MLPAFSPGSPSFRLSSSTSEDRQRQSPPSLNRSMSNIRFMLPWQFYSINCKASPLSSSITFSSFSVRMSPMTTNLVGVNLRVTMNFLESMSLTLTRWNSSGSVRATLLSSCRSQQMFFLFFLPVISSMMMGQLVMFLMTALVFLHSFLNLWSSQSDFRSWSRLSILAFSTSIDWNWRRRRVEFRLPLPFISEELRFLSMMWVILLRSSRFSLSISVNLFSFCISFFLELRVRQLSVGSAIPVLGRTFLRLLRWFCRHFSFSILSRTLLAKG